MFEAYPYLVVTGPASLLIAGMVSTDWANRHPFWMKTISFTAASLALIVACAATSILIFCGSLDAYLIGLDKLPVHVGVYFDSLSAVMMLLISFIGVVITGFSARYLDGEPRQGRFLRWICFTLGAVLLFVASSNLVMFTATWMLTSFGLHQLLTHYHDRPGAILAARKKFLISRLGDVLLIAALVLTYQEFGSFDYGVVLATASRLNEPPSSWQISAISTLFVLGAMTKSAQFPVHSWLPDTMETPTPVSALMHAGIINAGGFLVIRLSPLISMSRSALHLLAVIGVVTATYAALVGMTQTTVKRSLAYSTIAQMGFMMLECGLGAFSAALLHIVAHSLYKAHAFLRSGSTVELPSPCVLAGPAVRGPFAATLWLLGVLAMTACIVVLKIKLLGGHSVTGSIVLSLVIAFAMLQILWPSKRLMTPQMYVRASILAALMLSCYLAASFAFEGILGHSISYRQLESTAVDIILVALVTITFGSILLLQQGLFRTESSPSLRSLYVHASNGFYADIVAHRLVRKLRWAC